VVLSTSVSLTRTGIVTGVSSSVQLPERPEAVLVLFDFARGPPVGVAVVPLCVPPEREQHLVDGDGDGLGGFGLDDFLGAAAAGGQPLGDEPVVGGFRLGRAVDAEVVVAAAEAHDGLTAGLVLAELGNGRFARHGCGLSGNLRRVRRNLG
jgi:hypothetical protein